MMKDFENIGKRLPYRETPEYVSRLIEQTTERTLQQSRRPKATLRPLLRYAAAAAVAALLVLVGISVWSPSQAGQQVAQTETASPVDDFLNSISDEEAQLLAYYEVDDIPDYE